MRFVLTHQAIVRLLYMFTDQCLYVNKTLYKICFCVSSEDLDLTSRFISIYDLFINVLKCQNFGRTDIKWSESNLSDFIKTSSFVFRR